MKRISYLILIVVFAAGIFLLLHFYDAYTADVTTPLSSSTAPTVFTIKDGQTVDEIGTNLQKSHLIRSLTAFKIYVRLHNVSSKLQAGIYKIHQNWNMQQVIAALEQGSFYKLVVIPSGTRKEEVSSIIEATLSQNNSDKQFSVDAFTNDINTPSKFAASYPFLQYIPQGKGMEGFLYNGNYLMADDTTADDAVKTLLSSFDQQVMHNIDQTTIGENGLTFYQDLVLASIVDKEAASLSYGDKRMIADIFIRRLQQGITLGSDVTVEYAKGYSPQKNTWWDGDITANDLQNPSPYNTRLNPGLPPTPIDSPDISSINAVLTPKPNNYLYFLTDAQGQIHFATTLEEQNNNTSRYL